MSTIDDPAVVCGIGVGLCTKLETKIFDNIYLWLGLASQKVAPRNVTNRVVDEPVIVQHCSG